MFNKSRDFLCIHQPKYYIISSIGSRLSSVKSYNQITAVLSYIATHIYEWTILTTKISKYRNLPEPPHISIFIREIAVGVITAVLDIIKSTAENSSSVTVRCGTGEALHKSSFSAAVTRTYRAHDDAGVRLSNATYYFYKAKLTILVEIPGLCFHVVKHERQNFTFVAGRCCSLIRGW